MELIYLGKFSTHRAFLLNAFLGTLFSTNLSFLWNFILLGKNFYTYSFPTERFSSCSLFLQTFRSYGTLFYLEKFSTHIAFLRNAFSRWSLFLQTFRSYGTYLFGNISSTHIAFLRNASYKSNRPSSSFQHQT